MLEEEDRFTSELLARGQRRDGRTLRSERPLSVHYGVAGDGALSSVMVRRGAGTVVCAARPEFVPPHPSEPAQGCVTADVSLFNGAVGFNTQSQRRNYGRLLAKQVEDVLSHNKVVDLAALKIIEGEVSWALRLEFVVLDATGTMLDLCMFAAMATLKSIRLPKWRCVDSFTTPLTVTSRCIVLPVSIGVCCTESQPTFVTDLTAEEERVVQHVVTVFCVSNGANFSASGSSSRPGKLRGDNALAGYLAPETLLSCHSIAERVASDMWKTIR